MASFKPAFSGDLHLTTWKVIILTQASAYCWTFLRIRTPKRQSELSALDRCPLYRGHKNDVTLFKASLQTLVLTEYNLTCIKHSISSSVRFTSQLHIRISLKLVVKHAIMQCCTYFLKCWNYTLFPSTFMTRWKAKLIILHSRDGNHERK